MNRDILVRRKKGEISLNLFYLRYFVKLAHVQHYTRAAEQLCITQPSLSHAISQLEQELGVPLFEKTGRNTALTRFGEEFLVCAEHTLSTLDEGVASLQRSARGEGLIRLGLLRTLGVSYIPQLAAGFLADNPDKDIQFTFHTGVTKELLDGLAARKFDLVFCSQPPPELDLCAVAVKKQDLVVITPRNHPLSKKHSATPEELVQYPFIYFSEGAGLRGIVDQMFLKAGVKPAIVCETEEDQVIAGLVAQGFGVSVVPYMDLLLKLDLHILQLDSEARERAFFMAHDERVFLPPAVRHFRRFVLDADKKQP